MTVSVGDSFIIAGVILVVLAAFIGIVLWMNRRPYAKHPKRVKTQTGVHGGIHEGDPRSVSPHRDEVVEPPPEDAPLTGRYGSEPRG
ncbi:MAG TPA: hypothetical protein VGI74_01450 [Streptosporangiaceae bacterium]